MKDTVLAVLGVVSLFLIIGVMFALVLRSEENDQLKLIKNSGSYQIYYDKETKVEYIREVGRDGGLTVRLDTNGKPILYNEKEER